MFFICEAGGLLGLESSAEAPVGPKRSEDPDFRVLMSYQILSYDIIVKNLIAYDSQWSIVSASKRH